MLSLSTPWQNQEVFHTSAVEALSCEVYIMKQKSTFVLSIFELSVGSRSFVFDFVPFLGGDMDSHFQNIKAPIGNIED